MTYAPPVPTINDCADCQSLYLSSEGCICLTRAERVGRRLRNLIRALTTPNTTGRTT